MQNTCSVALVHDEPRVSSLAPELTPGLTAFIAHGLPAVHHLQLYSACSHLEADRGITDEEPTLTLSSPSVRLTTRHTPSRAASWIDSTRIDSCVHTCVHPRV
jgi:hypothetical protein